MLLIISKNAGVQLNIALPGFSFIGSFDFVVVELSSPFFVVLSVVEILVVELSVVAVKIYFILSSYSFLFVVKMIFLISDSADHYILMLVTVVCSCRSSFFNTTAAFAVNVKLSRGTVSLKIYTDL